MNLKFLSSCLVFCGILSTTLAIAQSNNAPLNQYSYYLIDRYEIRNGQLSTNFDTNVKPYMRKAIGRFLDSVDMALPSRADRFNLSFLAEDNYPWAPSGMRQTRSAILKYFYKNSRDFYSVKTDGLQLSVNPVLNLQVGQDINQGLNYLNTRGIQVEGMIDDKVGFYTYIGENQMLLPSYVDQYVRQTLTVPQEGFWKEFQGNGVDFLTARGHFTFNATRHITMQLGHGKHFIGNGYRSLVLSDFANNYLYFKINTQVWKLNYTNIFAKMTADIVGNRTGLYGTVDFPAKYFTFHRLGANITKNLNIGLFESIVHGDSTQQFEIEYLNPIILYRGVEQQGGSTGNAVLGLDMKWNLFHHLSIYGQALIDEFVISEIKSNQGWWGNKYALQAGVKYVDVLNVPNLDMQLEYNRVRPYTYAHEDLFRSYTHYEQPLAHPLGANFRETIAILRYQPLNRLILTARLINASYGADMDSTNYGHNILLDNRTREQEYDNILEQGIKTSLAYKDLIVSWQVFHNLFLDVRYTDRVQNSTQNEQSNSMIMVGMRLNAAERMFEF